jgi:hypothetical protein
VTRRADCQRFVVIAALTDQPAPEVKIRRPPEIVDEAGNLQPAPSFANTVAATNDRLYSRIHVSAGARFPMCCSPLADVSLYKFFPASALLAGSANTSSNLRPCLVAIPLSNRIAEALALGDMHSRIPAKSPALRRIGGLCASVSPPSSHFHSDAAHAEILPFSANGGGLFRGGCASVRAGQACEPVVRDCWISVSRCTIV